MSESLGLSIGVANLVAARSGGAPVARTPVLTLFDNRQSEVGLPEENPNLTEPGLVLRGFIERVGDPAPLVAADGTKYLGQALTIEALEAMARTVGYGRPLTIAVPAYWSDNQVAALRQELVAQPDLAANGGPPTLVSDASAALAGLQTRPGLPRDGVVALCDFGAGGTSVTLANAAANFQQIGATVRHSEFSGDDIDQLILSHLLTVTPSADNTDVSGTATSMGSVTRMLGGCRAAKEQLSTTTVATVSVGAAGATAQLTRSDFEQLISAPLDRFISAVGEVLQRNGIGQLAAVATVGGGASIPVITTRLSQRLQVPVVGADEPRFAAAIGAVALGDLQASSAGAATGLAPAIDVPTGLAPAVDVPTTAAAVTGASPTAAVPTEQFSENSRETTDRALAWSEDSGTSSMEPVPYTGPADYTGPVEPPPAPAYTGPPRDQNPAEPEHPIWYRRPAILLSLAGAAAAIIVAVVLALTLHPTSTKPVVVTSQPPPTTTVVTGSDNLPTTTVITPSPVTVTTEPSSSTTTPPTNTSSTSTTSTTSSATTTTTQPTTTTTQPTTTAPTTTQAPPTTTQAPPTTTQAPPTTAKPPTTGAAPATPTTGAAGG